MKHKTGVRIRWLNQKGRVRKKNLLNCWNSRRDGVPVETDVLKRGDEKCPSVNAAKAERNVSIAYAEKKVSYANMRC